MESGSIRTHKAWLLLTVPHLDNLSHTRFWCLPVWRVAYLVSLPCWTGLEYILTIASPGIQGKDTLYSWFTTQFTIPPSFKDQNVLVNFAAVDYEATVFVNGKKAGFHRGGYFHFAFDITEFVNRDGENELYVPLPAGNRIAADI